MQAAKNTAKKQEARAISYSQKLEKARAELKERKPEKEVVDDFHKSGSQELSNAAAKKIHQCWLITEKHIQTDLEPS